MKSTGLQNPASLWIILQNTQSTILLILPVLAKPKHVKGGEQNNEHNFSWFGYDIYIYIYIILKYYVVLLKMFEINLTH